MKIIICSLALMLITSACSQDGHIKNNKYKGLFDKEYGQVSKYVRRVIVENEESAAHAASLLMSNDSKCLYSRKVYTINKTGVLADHLHQTKSNIYLPANVRITDDTWRVICATENLEKRWSDVESRYPEIGWQYITELSTKVTRTYPWLDEVAYMGPYVDYTKVPQWTLVEPRNNQSRQSKCTNVYFDHDGLGYVVTCAAPIYSNDLFLGNMSVDMPIGRFFSKIRTDDNVDSGNCPLIIDVSGAIISSKNGSLSSLCNSIINSDMLDKEHPLMKCLWDDCVCDGEHINEINVDKKHYALMCKSLEPMNSQYVLIY